MVLVDPQHPLEHANQSILQVLQVLGCWRHPSAKAKEKLCGNKGLKELQSQMAGQIPVGQDWFGKLCECSFGNSYPGFEFTMQIMIGSK
jgi:hypothetical protein